MFRWPVCMESAASNTASHFGDKQQPTAHGYIILETTKGDAIDCHQSQLQIPGSSVKALLWARLHQIVQDALQTATK